MQHKKNKEKNTFSKLRRQFKNALNRLDTEQRANNILNQEVQRLRSVLDIQQKQSVVLKSQLKTEVNRTSDLTNRLLIVKRNRKFFYRQWMQDHIKIKKWQNLCYVSIISNIVMLIFMIVK